jgi:hypothetical protein
MSPVYKQDVDYVCKSLHRDTAWKRFFAGKQKDFNIKKAG